MPAGQASANVRGVFCAAAERCVIVTESRASDPGAVFALSGTSVGEKLLDGKNGGEVSMRSDTFGDLDFVGLEPTPSGLVARVSVSNVTTIASGDPTQKSSWKISNPGRVGSDSFGLNETSALMGDARGKWVLINKRGSVFTASTGPSATTAWTKLWSPLGVPPAPADFAAQYAADPTLCESDVTSSGLPTANPAFVAPDLSLMVTVAGGLNQDGRALPGVCISTDQGQHFYNVPFSGLPTGGSSPGPRGVTCTDTEHCYAYNGIEYEPGTAYIYRTSNASSGKASTWVAASVPPGFATAEDIHLDGMFFAPDKTHGWAVGNKAHHALLLRTTDGGQTWSDVSASVRSVLDHDLYGGFALDANHVWLAGRFGTLLVSSTAQQ